jgi:hypothetical protein
MKYLRSTCLFVLPTLLILSACDKKQPAAQAPAGGTQQTASAEPDWCAEHGVPESICTRCNKKLIADFKKSGDWCKEHDLPESQCLLCNPDLKEKFEAMKPKDEK